MQILAKSAADPAQIKDKLEKGCDGIEIQLLGDFLDEKNNAQYYYQKIISCAGADVQVVHMPLIKHQDVNLELLTYPVYLKAFKKAVLLSQMLAEEYHHNVILILHNTLTLDQYQHMPVLLREIETLLEYACDNFPQVEYAIENILPLELPEGKTPLGRNGFGFDNVDLTSYFNERFETCNKFGTVIDTCHAMASYRMLAHILTEDHNGSLKRLRLEDFFIKNHGLLKVIHLTNVHSMGFNPGEHGCSFEPDSELDVLFLNRFFDLYYKYASGVPITIEVYEKDYLDSQSYLKTKNMIQKYVMPPRATSSI